MEDSDEDIMLEEESEGEKRTPEDTFKILIATDCHLGYEQNRKRGNESDSFITFEEILTYAKTHDVDFILLGGDLFHDTKPSQNVVMQCMSLLRKYCLGPRKQKIKFLSDPEVIFQHCQHKVLNYEDPNINVSIPVFSIHGNHDDPSFGSVGSLDLLAVSGLVNYFGKWTDLTRVIIPPLIFKKGKSHVALYGLSYLNDQRLSRLFRDFKVDMLKSEEMPECFNIFVLHQNRVKHAEYAYIPENRFPNFLNFILWGHEHECRIEPEYIEEQNYYICQPGSSIATSLCQAEAEPKHVAILQIHKFDFQVQKLKLKTVRPFVFDNLFLDDEENISKNYIEKGAESIYEYVDNYIENMMIPKAAKQLTGHPQQPHQPLIRLRIFYSNEEHVFDTIRLAQKYCDEVANPTDMIIFRKVKGTGSKAMMKMDADNDAYNIAGIFGYEEDERNWNKSIIEGIKKHFESQENQDKLTVLSVTGLNEALMRFVEKNDGDAFKDVIKHQKKKTMERLQGLDVELPEDILEEIKKYRDERLEKDKEEEMDVREMLNDNNRKFGGETLKDLDDSVSDEESSDFNKSAVIGKGTRGVKRGRPTSSKVTSRGRSKAVNKSIFDLTESPPPTSKARARGRGTASNAKAAQKTQDLKGQSSMQNFLRPQQSESRSTKAKTLYNVTIFDDSD
ncbi:double-strand break repair protein MRE11 [Orussus abietinus]|uniref:double-strand break repair protein MRE11 n=1 Tax=Orussus abietinus TaxID=222816 RepID=UPI000624F9FD|nr:double-strand break repair protein MRE11 [Orussus abietinus]